MDYNRYRSVFVKPLFVLTFIIAFTSCTKDEVNITPEMKYHKVWLAPLPMDITTDSRPILEDFMSVVSDPDTHYPDVFKHTGVFKTYIEALMRYTPEEIQQLADFTNQHNLEVAIEVGGMRTGVGHVANDQLGVKSAQFEFRFINKFIQAGGKVNYISSDHAMAKYFTGADKALSEMTIEQILEQQILYFKYMQEQIDGLKVGTIESLGYFWVNGDKQYAPTVTGLTKIDFNEFLDTFLAIAKQNGVAIDHYHIDFGAHDVTYDGGYGRILAAEDYIMSKGIESGFIATNAFHIFSSPETMWKMSDEESAGISSAKRALIYFEEYIKAGGKSDYLVLQRWQPYPVSIGSQEEPYTQMGIFNSILSSPYFPKH